MDNRRGYGRDDCHIYMQLPLLQGQENVGHGARRRHRRGRGRKS